MSGREVGYQPMDGPAQIGLDGRFTIGEFFGMAAGWRGHWVGDSAFNVELQVLERTNERLTFEFTFEDSTAQLEIKPMGGKSAVLTADRT